MVEWNDSCVLPCASCDRFMTFFEAEGSKARFPLLTRKSRALASNQLQLRLDQNRWPFEFNPWQIQMCFLLCCVGQHLGEKSWIRVTRSFHSNVYMRYSKVTSKHLEKNIEKPSPNMCPINFHSEVGSRSSRILVNFNTQSTTRGGCGDRTLDRGELFRSSSTEIDGNCWNSPQTMVFCHTLEKKHRCFP